MNIKIKKLCETLESLLGPWLKADESTLARRLALDVQMCLSTLLKQSESGAGAGSAEFLDELSSTKRSLDLLVILRMILALKATEEIEDTGLDAVSTFVHAIESAIKSLQPESIFSPLSESGVLEEGLLSPCVGLVRGEDFPVGDSLPEVWLDTCIAELACTHECPADELVLSDLQAIFTYRPVVTHVLEEIMPSWARTLLGYLFEDKIKFERLIVSLWMSEDLAQLEETDADVLLQYLGTVLLDATSLFPNTLHRRDVVSSFTPSFPVAMCRAIPFTQPFLKLMPFEKLVQSIVLLAHHHLNDSKQRTEQACCALTTVLAALPMTHGHVDTAGSHFIRAGFQLLMVLYALVNMLGDLSDFVKRIQRLVHTALIFFTKEIAEEKLLSSIIAVYMHTLLNAAICLSEPLEIMLGDELLQDLIESLSANKQGLGAGPCKDRFDFSFYTLAFDSLALGSVRRLQASMTLVGEGFLNELDLFDLHHVSLFKLDGILQQEILLPIEGPVSMSYHFIAEWISLLHMQVKDPFFTDYFSEVLGKINKLMSDTSSVEREITRVNMQGVCTLVQSMLALKPLMKAFMIDINTLTTEQALQIAYAVSSLSTNAFLYIRLIPTNLTGHLSESFTEQTVLSKPLTEVRQRVMHMIESLNYKLMEFCDTLAFICSSPRFSGGHRSCDRTQVIADRVVYTDDRANRSLMELGKLVPTADSLREASTLQTLFTLIAVLNIPSNMVKTARRTDFFKERSVKSVGATRPPLHPSYRPGAY